MARLSVRPVKVFSTLEGQDEEGLLVLFDGRLSAVLIRLGSIHGEEEGFWNLEVGFGACTGRPATFKLLSQALRWIAERCLSNPGELESEIIDLQRGR